MDVLRSQDRFAPDAQGLRPRLRSHGRAVLAAVVALVVSVAVLSAAGPAQADSGFTVTPFLWSPHSFSPEGDGSEDTLDGYYQLNAAANVDVTVRHTGGAVVRSLETGVSHSAGTSSFSWDGKDSNGHVVPDGAYQVVVTGTDATATSSTATFDTSVDTAPVATLTAPAVSATVSGTVSWRVVPAAGRAVNGVSGPGAGGTAQPDGSWTGTFDSTTTPNGSSIQSWFVYWSEANGSSHTTRLDRSLTFANPLVVLPGNGWTSRSFSPNADGVEDTISGSYCFSSTANATVTVRRSGTVVRTLDTALAVTGSGAASCFFYVGASWSWDGRDDGGNVVPDGAYDVVVTGTPTSGPAASYSFRTSVDTAPVGTVTAPVAGSTVSGSLTWRLVPAAGRTVTGVYSERGDTGSLAGDGSWQGALDTTAFANGARSISWYVQWSEANGAQHTTLVSVPVDVENSLSVLPDVYWRARSFSPNGDGNDDSVYSGFCVSSDATVDVTVVRSGTVVRTISTGTPVAGTGSVCQYGTTSWSWDGLDDGGAVVPDGAYQVVVSATTASGRTTSSAFDVDVDNAPVVLIAAPAASATVTGASVPWRVDAAAGRTVSRVDGPDGSGTQRPDGSWSGTLDSTRYANGPATLYWSFTWTDRFGYDHYNSITQQVTASNTVHVLPVGGWQPRAFSPAIDGSLTGAFCVSGDAAATVQVLHAGTVVRTLSGPDAVVGSGAAGCAYYQATSWSWDGLDDHGTQVPDGAYQVVVTATPATGPSSTYAFDTIVDTAPVGTVSSPAAGSTVAGLVGVALTPGAGRHVSQVQFCFPAVCVTGFNPSVDGVWRSSVFASQLTAGPQVLTVNVTYTDDLGAVHYRTLPDVSIVVDTTSIPLSIKANPASGTAPLATGLAITTSDPGARNLSYRVVWGDGSADSTGTIANPYADVTVNHTYATTGSFTPRVTVTDGVLTPASATTVITTTARATTTSVSCAPGAPVAGQAVTCTATVSPTSGTGVPTGSVVLALDGGTGTGVALDATSKATWTLPAGQIGGHTVTATYGGDSVFASSTGSSPVTVARAATTTTLVSSSNPATAGQSVTFTASVAVTAPGSGTPTGSIDFVVDGTTTTVALNASGSASLTTSSLSAGTHTVTASYGGDMFLLGSTAATLSQRIDPLIAATTTTVVCAPEPSVFGQPASCTATVTSSAPVSGTVQFSVDGAPVGSPQTLVAGAASLAVTSLAVGSHPVGAAFTPTTGAPLSPSTGSAPHVVGRASSSTQVSCLPSSSVFGQSVTCTVSVLTTAPGVATPTGSVQLSVDGVPVGPLLALSAGATASQTLTGLQVGDRAVTASYGGDGHLVGSTGSTTQPVGKASSTTQVSCVPEPSVAGQQVTCTAVVSVVAPGAATPSGTVQFSVDGTDTGASAVLDATGRATFTSSALAVGSRSVAGAYSGDAHVASSSGSATHVVDKAATSTSLLCSPTPAQVGTAVSCTVTVSVTAPGSGVPTGTVALTVDGAGTGSPAALSATGTATLTLPALAVGTHPVSVSYAGDAGTTGSSSGDVTVEIVAVPVLTTSTGVVCSPTAPVHGQAVSCTVTVTDAAASAPTGTVAVTVDGQPLGTPRALVGGSTTVDPGLLAVGHHSVAASFTGSAGAGLADSSGSAGIDVGQATTATTIDCTPATPVFGQQVSCALTVAVQTPGAGTPTGTVGLDVDGTVLGPALALDASGHATSSSLTLPVGSHTVRATYSGDASTSTSVASTTVAVAAASTLTSLSCGPVPADPTTALSCTATVHPVAPGAGTPTGTVAFTVGGTQLGSPVALAADGTAAVSLGTRAAGSYPVVATYSGDGSFQGSSGAQTLAVGDLSRPTTSSLVCTPTPTTYGATTTCTTTVSTSDGTVPTGDVQFVRDGASVGAAVHLDASGRAAYDASGLEPGNYQLAATYTPTSGSTFGSSNANVVLTVLRAPTTTGISCTPTSPVTQQTLFCTAPVTDASGAGGTPTGIAQLYVDGALTAFGSVTNGSATLATPALVGSHVVRATYTGDGHFLPSDSQPKTVVTLPGATTTAVVCAPKPAVVSAPVTCTATVTPTAPAAGNPNGSVTFDVDSTGPGAPVALDAGGQAQLVTSSLGIGTHTVVARYSGSSDFTASTSSAFSETVVAGTSTTTLACTPTSVIVGGTTACTATVTASGTGAGTPTGSVAFSVDGAQVGTVALTAAGTATLSGLSLTAGSHGVIAKYLGNGTLSASSSRTVTVTVTRLATTTTQVCAPPTIVVGSSVTCTATVTATGGGSTPTGSVTFTPDSASSGTAVALAPDGTATFTTTSLPAGTRTIAAAYGGDATYATSRRSSTVTVLAAKYTTAGTLSCSPNPLPKPATATTCTFTLTTNAAKSPPGTAKLTIDGAAFAATPTVSSAGVATFRLPASTLSVGRHTLVASYDGTALYDATSASTLVRVAPVAAPDPVLTGTAAEPVWQVGAGRTLCAGTHLPVPLPQGRTCDVRVRSPVGNDTFAAGTTAVVDGIDFASGEYSGLGADGSFWYAAGDNTSTEQTKRITYHLVDADGVTSPSVVITVQVHRRPTAVSPPAYTIRAGQTLCIGPSTPRAPGTRCTTWVLRTSGLLTGATKSPKATGLTAHSVAISFAQGEYSDISPDGSLTYVAGGGTSTTQTKVITFVVVDSFGSVSDTRTVTITVKP